MAEDYTVGSAGYAKGMLIVRTPNTGGWKTRAHRLIGDGLRARWSNRERGYIASPAKVKKFERLYAQGWDGSFITGQLIPPDDNEEESHA